MNRKNRIYYFLLIVATTLILIYENYILITALSDLTLGLYFHLLMNVVIVLLFLHQTEISFSIKSKLLKIFFLLPVLTLFFILYYPEFLYGRMAEFSIYPMTLLLTYCILARNFSSFFNKILLFLLNYLLIFIYIYVHKKYDAWNYCEYGVLIWGPSSIFMITWLFIDLKDSVKQTRILLVRERNKKTLRIATILLIYIMLIGITYSLYPSSYRFLNPLFAIDTPGSMPLFIVLSCELFYFFLLLFFLKKLKKLFLSDIILWLFFSIRVIVGMFVEMILLLR